MFKRNIEVSRRQKVEGMREDLENIRISEEINNRKMEKPRVEPMNLDVIMNCSLAYLIANVKNK